MFTHFLKRLQALLVVLFLDEVFLQYPWPLFPMAVNNPQSLQVMFFNEGVSTAEADAFF
jgi:type VI protein secretion system component VasF